LFTEKFDDYACEGETITCEKDGFTVVARIERDDDMGPPWKEHDGHGPVSEWRPKDSKRPGEKILVEDRGSCRFYDWQEAIKIAKRDGWDAPPYGEGTAGERAERAVQRDFDHLKEWCNDGWTWCSIVLCVSKGGVEVKDYAACLGGIALNDDDNGYLSEVANQLLDEAIEAGKKAAAAMVEALS
jgi:hypothetical protein